MKIFFDTSALFQLYHAEANTQSLLFSLAQIPDYKVVISQITFVEMYSALFKKVRIGHLQREQAEKFLPVLERDFKKFLVIPIDSTIINSAQQFSVKYGLQGLRSLDAIQLASAVSAKNDLDIAITNDVLLKQFLTNEGLKTDF